LRRPRHSIIKVVEPEEEEEEDEEGVCCIVVSVHTVKAHGERRCGSIHS
jgi:hypothetical protein